MAPVCGPRTLRSPALHGSRPVDSSRRNLSTYQVNGQSAHEHDMQDLAAHAAAYIPGQQQMHTMSPRRPSTSSSLQISEIFTRSSYSTFTCSQMLKRLGYDAKPAGMLRVGILRQH